MEDTRRRGRLEPVGPVIHRLFAKLGLDRRLDEYRAVQVWPEVVGPTIAGHAHAVAIREGVLFVDVDSSVWMQELGFLRDGIAERLNKHLGASRVRKIVLSLDRSPTEEPGDSRTGG